MRLINRDESLAALHCVTDFDVNRADGACSWGRNLGFHLHCLENEQHLPGLNRLAFLDQNLADRPASGATTELAETPETLAVAGSTEALDDPPKTMGERRLGSSTTSTSTS